MRAPQISAFLIFLALSCDGDPDTPIATTIQIQDGSYLFVDGYEMTGEVEILWNPNDTLKINGIPARPQRYRDTTYELPPDDVLLRRYSKTPYFATLLSRGFSPETAVRTFGKRVEQTFDEITDAYHKEFGNTGSHESAMKALKMTAAAADSILNLEREPEVNESTYSLHLQGREPIYLTLAKPSTRVEGSPYLTKAGASNLIKRMRSYLETDSGPCVVVISYSAHMFFGGNERVKQLRDQIEKGMRGEITDGVVSRNTLKVICDRKRESEAQ